MKCHDYRPLGNGPQKHFGAAMGTNTDKIIEKIVDIGMIIDRGLVEQNKWTVFLEVSRNTITIMLCPAPGTYVDNLGKH